MSEGHAPGKRPSAGKHVSCSRPSKRFVFTGSEASLGFKNCSKSPNGQAAGIALSPSGA